MLLHHGAVRMDLPDLRLQGIRAHLGRLGILGHRGHLALLVVLLALLVVLLVRGCSIVRIRLVFLVRHCHWGRLVHRVHRAPQGLRGHPGLPCLAGEPLVLLWLPC